MVEAFLDLLESLFVFGLTGQFEQDIQILQLPVDPRPGLEGRLELVLLPQNVFCPLRLVPEGRLCRLLFEFGKTLRQYLYVKDNLAGFPPAS
jgi:hypothetical protein